MRSLGADAEDMMAEMFENISVDACTQVDCLHPCYGASHERGCNRCLLFAVDYLKKGEDVIFTDEQLAACDLCSLTPEEIVVPAFMSFDEFKAAVRAK